MRFGLSFPNFGGFAEPEALVRLATSAEDAGWDGFFIWDHIVIADGMPIADPWVTLGAIAAATERIMIGPMVIALPRHRPWVVASQSVTLDRLSGGRFVLGVGIGFPPGPEFGTFADPEDERTRADMLDEGLEIIQGVWSGEPFAHRATHYTIEEHRFAPTPLTRIPIWVAGMLPNRRPLRRAARHDGVIPIRADMAELTTDDVIFLRDYIARHRTSDEPFDIVVGGPPVTRDHIAELEGLGVTWYVAGPSPEGEEIADTERWVSRGPAGYIG